MSDTHTIGTTRMTVVRGDITAQDVDVVVNAANEHLAHGGGVALAIARAAGPELQEESNRWVAEHGPVRPGTAAVTTGGRLPAAHVVHVVGPRYAKGRDNAGALRAAVAAALDATAALGAKTLAMPAISAGIFGYPLDEATAVIVDAAARWVGKHPGALDEVRFVGYEERAARAFVRALDTLDDGPERR